MICKLCSCFPLAILGSLILATAVNAGINYVAVTDLAPSGAAVHDPYTPPNPPFDPSSSDLLTGISPVLVNPNTSLYFREESAGPDVLTDGSVSTVYAEAGPGGDAVDHAAYTSLGEEELLIWDLGGLYNLSKAVVFGGWNDGGRDQTFFGFDVSTDGGATFTQLIAPNVNESSLDPISHRVEITDDASPFFAYGVTHVRLDPGGVENGWTGYSEVDVFGVEVPEPTALVLAALVAGIATATRRRS